MKVKKIPRYAYKRLLKNVDPVKDERRWDEVFNENMEQRDWSVHHSNNFSCTIETQVRSFYFKLFHNAIGTNAFLHKIKKIESPNCFYCSQSPETLVHLFCKCPKVIPLWQKLLSFISMKLEGYKNFTTYGIYDSML